MKPLKAFLIELADLMEKYDMTFDIVEESNGYYGYEAAGIEVNHETVGEYDYTRINGLLFNKDSIRQAAERLG